MSTKRDHLVETAERLFYRDGFHATGIDRVIAEAGVARMTLYKHFPSKDDLVLAVLERREAAYWATLTAAVENAGRRGDDPLMAVLDAHCRWLCGLGGHGCLLLRAIGEYAGHAPRIAETAIEQKRRLLAFIHGLIVPESRAGAAQLAEPLVMLMEGATALAQVLPPETVAAQARAAARDLMEADTRRGAAA